MPNLQSLVDFELSESTFTIFCPSGSPTSVDASTLIEFINDYALNSTDIDGSELYNAPSPEEYLESYPEKVCDKYFKYIIKPTLDFTYREALNYINGVLASRAFFGNPMSSFDIRSLFKMVESEYGIKMNGLLDLKVA